jgi:putative FmdB family regulatory protein
MPLYGYCCDKCDNKFDKFLSINDRNIPLVENCSKCDGGKIIRDYSGFSQSVGVDVSLTPDTKTNGQWSKLMTKMKKGLSPRFHHNLDKTANHTGARWH